jgi:hypothetical protein
MIPREKTTQLALQYMKALQKSDVAEMRQTLELFEVHLFQYLPEDDIKERYVQYFNSVHSFDKKLVRLNKNVPLPESVAFILKHYLECAKLLNKREVFDAYKQKLQHEILEFLSLIKDCLAIRGLPDFRYDPAISSLLLAFFKFIMTHAESIHFTPVKDIHERVFETIERKFAKVPGGVAEEIRQVLACMNKIFYGQVMPTENFWVIRYGKLGEEEIPFIREKFGFASASLSSLGKRLHGPMALSNSSKRIMQETEAVTSAGWYENKIKLTVDY